MVRLVVVDDDAAVLKLIAKSLEQPYVEIHCRQTAEEAWKLIREIRPDIVVADYTMPGMGGMELLERIVAWDSSIDVIILTGHLSTDLAVTAIQKGGADFITKCITPAALRQRLEPFIQGAIHRHQAELIDAEVHSDANFNGLIGRSAPMLEILTFVRRVARHFRTVLVTGATGTGKELVARALHACSPYRDRPFVVCNCAAIAESLFESELFGHVRGAFTGANEARMGMFEAADGGVLFLDEVGEVPLGMQAKLLRAIQNGEVRRVGSSATKNIDVRVVAATNRDLKGMVERKEFREDLYYRLSMLEVRMPSLAARKEDLPLLQRHFLDKFSAQMGRSITGVTRRARIVLSRHNWPGNIRELENVLGHACTMTESSVLDVTDLPLYLRSSSDPSNSEESLLLEDVVKRHIRLVYERSGHNKQLAAQVLGISRATIYRYLGEDEIPVLSH